MGAHMVWHLYYVRACTPPFTVFHLCLFACVRAREKLRVMHVTYFAHRYPESQQNRDLYMVDLAELYYNTVRATLVAEDVSHISHVT